MYTLSISVAFAKSPPPIPSLVCEPDPRVCVLVRCACSPGNIAGPSSSMRQEIARRRQQVRDSERAWHRLQRRNLHPHYSSSILDDTVNNEGEGLQAAVNRVIAGE